MNNKLIGALSGVAAVVMLAAVCANVYVITKLQPGTLNTVLSSLLILTSVAGIYYILAGCRKKEGSVYYHWFMTLFAACALVLLITVSGDAATTACVAVAYGSLCILSVAKDLGKKNSLIFTALVTLAAASRCFMADGTARDAVIAAWTMLALAAVSLLMVVAKYRDKASRGSK